MFDIKALIRDHTGENFKLHSQHINPQFAKVLKTIGFDKIYVRAEGPHLYDQNGKCYLDFLSGYGVFGLGRNHPTIKKVLHDCIDEDLASMVQMETPLLSGLLASQLIKRLDVDGLDTVFFTNSGTESIEAAIKFARAATGRERILYLDHAFHGLSTGSLSLNGSNEFREPFGPLLPGAKIALNDLAGLELELSKKDVAAFFFEPIQGKGVHIPNDLFLLEAQRLCKKQGTLFVADEVQTGLGRTGKWFGFEHWNLKPDMVAIAKTLSGGMVPVGALVYRRDIYDKVYSRMDRCVVHSSTFGKNNLAMACGLATLSVLEEEKLVERSAQLGDQLLHALQDLQAKHEWIQEVRGRGLLIGIEFGKPKSFSKKIKWEMVHSMDRGLFAELIVMPLLSKHQILTQVAGHQQDIIKILPPYVIDESHIEKFCNALDSVLSECDQISGPIWKMGKNLIQHSLENRRAS